MHAKKRRRILKSTKSYKWGRKKLIKQAITAAHKAGVHAWRDRKIKKRTARGLWQIRLNAGLREHNLTYAKFIKLIKDRNIGLDRKILATLAKDNPKIFNAIIEQIKNNLAGS